MAEGSREARGASADLLPQQIPGPVENAHGGSVADSCPSSLVQPSHLRSKRKGWTLRPGEPCPVGRTRSFSTRGQVRDRISLLLRRPMQSLQADRGLSVALNRFLACLSP